MTEADFNNQKSAKEMREAFKRRIGIRRASADTVKQETNRIGERIHRLYGNPVFTKTDSLSEEKEITEDISNLESEVLNTRRRYDEDIVPLIENIKSVHKETKELYLQALNESYNELAKEIERSASMKNSERVTKKKELGIIAESYMTFKSEVIDKDLDFREK
ncbi:hypothetical protein KY326_01560, partial [Candidatus Woesearchaeota archaeon]|nr:hypothetical protein [Candidatus Woesearchaeota archaeon]